jgi:hypothetical protein
MLTLKCVLDLKKLKGKAPLHLAAHKSRPHAPQASTGGLDFNEGTSAKWNFDIEIKKLEI